MHKVLPARPRIRPYFDVIFASDGGCQLRDGDDRILVLRGTTVTETFPLLFPHLDGTHTVADICERCRDIAPKEVLVTILERLNEEGILEDGATPSCAPEESESYSPQLLFFSRFTDDRYGYQAKLKGARAAVIGLGSIGQTVVISLATSGIGHLTGFDDSARVPWASTLPGAQGDRSERETTALSLLVEKNHPDVAFQAEEGRLETHDDVARAVTGNDVVIVAFDKPRLSIFEQVNRVCLDENIPWITCGSLNSIEGIVGPFMVPRETCCYKCYELRSKANLDAYSEYVTFEEYLREKDGRTADHGHLPSFPAVIGHLIALEVIKHLTQFVPPETYGSIFSINFLTLQAQRHEVLKLPRCPACGPAANTPPRALWSR